MYTLEDIKEAMPKGKRHLVTQGAVDIINRDFIVEVPKKDSRGREVIGTDGKPEMRKIDYTDVFNDTFMTYARIIEEGKYSIGDYVNAVKFVTMLNMKSTVYVAWKNTFPDKYKDKVAKGLTKADIEIFAYQYKGSQLVRKLLEVMTVPVYIVNAGLFQESLNTLRNIMIDPGKPAVARVSAGRAILEFTKQPEVKKMQLDVSYTETDEIKALTEATNRLAEAQLKAISEEKITLKEIIEGDIIDYGQEA